MFRSTAAAKIRIVAKTSGYQVNALEPSPHVTVYAVRQQRSDKTDKIA